MSIKNKKKPKLLIEISHALSNPIMKKDISQQQLQVEEVLSPSPDIMHYLIKSSMVGSIHDHYDIPNQKAALGVGSFGMVQLGIHKATKQKRAIKVIKKNTIQNVKIAQKEIEINKSLSHPYIAKFYETFEDKTNIYLVMELVQGGDLFDKLRNEGPLPENVARKYFKQMLSAIKYCHINNVCHRDLKLENFLVTEENQNEPSSIKLIDFGLSTKFSDNGDKQMQTKAGTSYYLAPEVITGKYDQSCDIWSCGVILYVMLCGYPPFFGNEQREILTLIHMGDLKFEGEEWEPVSKQAQDLISHILKKQDQRYTIDQILSHPWMKPERALTLTKQEKQRRNEELQIDYSMLKQQLKFSAIKRAFMVLMAETVTEEEARDLKRLFLGLDADCDGLLNFDEFKRAFSLQNVSQRKLMRLFKHMDIRKIDALDYYVFMSSCLMSEDVYFNSTRLLQIFQIFDYDQQGFISKKKLKQVFQKHEYYANKDDSYWDKILKQMDFNDDGKVDFKDIKHFFLLRG